MYNTRLSRSIMEAIARAGGQYRGIANLAHEVDRERRQVSKIIIRLEDEGKISITPAIGRGNCAVIKALPNE